MVSTAITVNNVVLICLRCWLCFRAAVIAVSARWRDLRLKAESSVPPAQNSDLIIDRMRTTKRVTHNQNLMKNVVTRLFHRACIYSYATFASPSNGTTTTSSGTSQSTLRLRTFVSHLTRCGRLTYCSTTGKVHTHTDGTAVWLSLSLKHRCAAPPQRSWQVRCHIQGQRAGELQWLLWISASW